MYVTITWLGVSTVLFMLFEITISLPSSIVLLILLLWYIQRGPNQKDTMKSSYNINSKINYCCMSCGTIHTREDCPQCGSKMKRAGFYISYLLSVSSIMIESVL
jgi:hypothetical protein